MSAVYAALHASPQNAGSFYATYWECETNEGYFPRGITPNVTDEIYKLSKEWAGIEDQDETETTSGACAAWLPSSVVHVVAAGSMLAFL